MTGSISPPRGSSIKARGLADGAVFRWPGQQFRQRVKWLELSGLLLVIACPLATAGIINSARMGFTGRVSLMASSVALLAGAAVCKRYHGLTFETLRMAPDSLTYRQPLSLVDSIEMLAAYEVPTVLDMTSVGHLLRAVVRRASRVELARSTVRSVELEGMGRYAHVVLRSADGDLAIGRFLSEADRCWLASVLRRWLETSTDAAAGIDA